MSSFVKHMQFFWLSGFLLSKKRIFDLSKDLLRFSSMEATQCLPEASNEHEKEIVNRKQNTRYAGRKYRRQWEDRKDMVENKTEKKLCDEPFERVKRRKVALLLGYSGADYFGMQRNPNMKTIEEDLCKALFSIKYINSEAFLQMQTIQFQRAARTDKGVSAARQVVSLKIVEHANVEDINKELPECIKVFDIKRVTKGFNSKKNCDARTYSYTLPTYVFEPECDSEESKTNFRITEEKKEKVNEVLSYYKGSKNYHNFTAKKDPEDPSTLRYMYSFEIDNIFVSSGYEFAVLKVKGQSFMLHQIRKMVGLALGVIRGMTDVSTMDLAFKKDSIDVPTAPSLGLVLEKVHYDRYNTRYSKDGIHASLEWSEMDEQVEKFKHEHIYPKIIKLETEENSMGLWIEECLMKHKFEIRDAVKRNDLEKSKEENQLDDKIECETNTASVTGENETPSNVEKQ